MGQPSSPRSAAVRYAAAALFVVGALSAQALFSGLLQGRAPLMFFSLAAILAALFGGWGPGIAAVLAGELLGDFFFIHPLHTAGPRTPVEWAYCLGFVGETATMVVLVEALRRSRMQLQKSFSLAQTRGDQLRQSLREIDDAEARIRELAAVVDSAEDAIISTNLEGQIKSWNGGAERLFGYTAAEMQGESVARLTPASRREELRVFSTALAGGRRLEAFETVRVRKDGREVPVSVSLSPVRDSAGNVTGASSIARDMSQLKRANAAEEALEKKFAELRAAQDAFRQQNQELADSRHALEAERTRYWELFNSAPVGYVITNPEGLVQQVNAVAAQMLQELPPALQGRPLVQLLAPEARTAFLGRLASLARNESRSVENWETTIQPIKGASFACSLLANRMEDPAEGLTGLRWILRDIRERKQVEDRILKLNSELEQRVRERTAALEAANREMEAFSYSVSHDLRAPLRSVVGFSKALMQDYADKLDDQGVLFLQCSYEAGLRMSRLIEDLLGLSRAARAELNQVAVDLSALAATLIAEFRKRDPGRKVHVKIAPDLRAGGDEGLLRIALENLLGNAWKFTGRKAEARIEVGCLERDGLPIFFVRDNGAGFSMVHARKLFGVFQRLHLQDEFPGTGIGLATVRRILNRHGGEVWAEGKIGEGATFYFRLPEAMPAPARLEAEAA